MVLATLNLISVTVTKISQFIFCKRLSFYFQQFDTISKPFFLHITANSFKVLVLTISVSSGTCRCRSMIPTNWWNNPPYVTTQISSNSSREGGILPVILESIVTSCCQECEFGTTTVDFKLDANGLDAQKDGVIQVKDAISSKTMISFGITGVMPQEKYYSADGEAEYVPIMETPGVAFIVAERRLDYHS